MARHCTLARPVLHVMAR
ncbi:MAG: hypothetical protein EZS28_004737, partial [Streblomastix strix]